MGIELVPIFGRHRGTILAFAQKLIDATVEQEKIAKKLQSNHELLHDNEAAIAAKYVFEIMYQFREEYSRDADFLKKWDAFYSKNLQ